MTPAITGPAPGGRRTVQLTVLLGMMVAAHSLLETARDSLFLARQPIERLPWLYLAVTVVVLPVTQLQALAGRRRGGSGALLATLIVSAAITLGFWATAEQTRSVSALYVWAALFSSIAFVQFWLVAVESFEVSEAKKVFGFIASGGLVGAVAGNALARLVLVAARPSALLLGSAGLMIGAAVLVRFIAAPARPAVQEPEVPVLRAVPHYLRLDPYFRLLGLLALLPALSALLIDFLFKATVASHANAAQIPATVANAYLAQSVIALVVELLVARFLLRKTGVTRTLLLLPLALLAVGAGFLVAGGLVLALAMRVVDSGLRPSLNRVGTELLYLPISPARRRLLKPSIDALGQRGGQALGSVLLLALLQSPRATTWIGGALLLTALGWIWVVRALRPLYLKAFREQLGGARAGASLPELDLASAEVLVAALGSPDAGRVLGSLELLARGGRLGLIPALILYHPDPTVVRAALDLLATTGRADVAAMLPVLLRHGDPEVRAAAAKRWLASGQEHEPLRALVTDPDLRVRAAALVALSALPEGQPELDAMRAAILGGAADERRELARAIADSPRADLALLLGSLFESGDVAARREVLRAAREVPLPASLLPAVVALLSDSGLRAEAQEALVAMGAPALEHLGARLLDESIPYRLDRELPPAVAAFPPAEAAPLLLTRIGTPRGGASRFRSLRALNRLQRADSTLRLDRGLLERALSIEIASAARSRDARLEAVALGISDRTAGGGGALLLEVLQSKEHLAAERVFRVLQLLFPDQGLERVYLGTRSARPAVRGAATEVLLELLPSPARERIFALLTDATPAPVAGSPVSPARRERFIVGLLGSSSNIVRLLAACIAAESRWREVLPTLRVVASEFTEDADRQAVLSAITTLEGGATAHG